MPSKSAAQAPELSAHPASRAVAPPFSARKAAADIFHAPDPSIHMLGLPKAHPRLGRWVALAILTGALVALTLISLFGG
ncbi:MAG: hypothetical protein WA192_15140 [Candidatus Acidiferrales bacterium]